MKSKVRPDMLMLELGLADSISKARSLILSGNIVAYEEKNGRILREYRVEKVGTPLPIGTLLRFKHLKDKRQYVSRGAFKLLGAIDYFKLSFNGDVALDIGASTGGFTEVLLENGASKVYAIDSGFNQIDYNLSKDSRVISLEGENFRTMPFEKVGEKVDAAVCDLSFISLELILPNIPPFLKEQAKLVALIKPQFEAERNEVEAGGIVRDLSVHRRVVESVIRKAIDCGFSFIGLIPSQIRGTKGNLEYLAYFIYNNGEVSSFDEKIIEQIGRQVGYECSNHSED